MRRIIFISTVISIGVLLFGCSGELTEEQLIEKAARIHDRALTIDTHVDTPLMLGRDDWSIDEAHDPRQGGGRVDFPRMEQGGLDAIFFAVYIRQGPRDPEANTRARERAIRLFETIHCLLESHSDKAELALSPEDAYRIERTGKRALFIGMENGYPLGQDLSLIGEYYDRGARYITLCHSRNNDICDSSTDRDGPEHGGLSAFGKKVIEEMNRMGMLIDVSHISDASFYDVIEYSKSPVLASHSCARALCDNPRNLDDDMLRALAENGGVIQVCFMSSYLKMPDPNPERDAAFEALREKFRDYDRGSEEYRDRVRAEWRAVDRKYPRKLATVSDVVDHIDHIVETVGIDHVGIGTDFDGGGGVEDCYDVSEMGNITLELVRRGYSENEIRKIWGGNFMRMFREARRMADAADS